MAYQTYYKILKVDIVDLVNKLVNEKSKNENNDYKS